MMAFLILVSFVCKILGVHVHALCISLMVWRGGSAYRVLKGFGNQFVFMYGCMYACINLCSVSMYVCSISMKMYEGIWC